MTPMDVAQKFVELSRGNGKTKVLIESLPDEPCAILVGDNDNIKTLKSRIAEQRPEYNVDNIEFLLYRPNSGWRDKLLFRNKHVFMDNDILDELIVLQVKAINDVYGKINKEAA